MIHKKQNVDAVIKSLTPQKPHVSYRSVPKALVEPEPKLYSIVLKNGSFSIVFLVKRTSRTLAESAARKYVELNPGNEVFGINLIDEPGLDAGKIVHIF